MFTEFQDKARKPLVFVSDVDGTILNLRGTHPAAANKGLIAFLITMKQKGHEVIITSMSGERAAAGVKLGLMLCKQDSKIFDIDGMTVIDKAHLEDFLHQRNISWVDYIFDDETTAYLPLEMVGEHIDPRLFLKPGFELKTASLPAPGI